MDYSEYRILCGYWDDIHLQNDTEGFKGELWVLKDMHMDVMLQLGHHALTVATTH